MKVEVAVLGSSSVIVLMVSVDIKQHLTLTGLVTALELCEHGGGSGLSFSMPFFPQSLIFHAVSLDVKHHERRKKETLTVL